MCPVRTRSKREASSQNLTRKTSHMLNIPYNFLNGFELISKMTNGTSQSAEIRRSAEKSHVWDIPQPSHTTQFANKLQALSYTSDSESSHNTLGDNLVAADAGLGAAESEVRWSVSLDMLLALEELLDLSSTCIGEADLYQTAAYQEQRLGKAPQRQETNANTTHSLRAAYAERTHRKRTANDRVQLL